MFIQCKVLGGSEGGINTYTANLFILNFVSAIIFEDLNK